ncbi:MAG: WD40 repeat domain-containing protein [Bacteroidetes bacterium]|nr:WD40 repeat domain-containing protein [Bacteroidota bacterium]
MQKKYFIILLHLVLHSFVLQSQVNIYPHFYKSELSLPVIKKWSTSGSYLAVAGISVSKSYSVNAVKVWNSKTGDSIASIVLAEFKTITSIDIDEQTNSLLYAVENYNFFSDEPKFKLYFLSLKTNSLLDSLAIEDKIIEIRNDKKNIYLFTQSDKNVALRSPDKFHCINRLSNKVVKSGLLHLEDIQIISYNKVNCLAYCNNNYWDKYRSLTIKDVAMPNDSVLFNDIEGEPKCVIEETTGQFIVASTTISNGIISIYNNKQQLSKIEIANVSDIKKIEVLNGILYVLVQSSNSSNKRSIYCYELSNMTQIDITNKVAEDAIDFKMNATGFAALSNIDTNYSFSYVNYSPVIIPITTQMQTPHSGAIYKMVSHSNKQLLATTSNDNHIKIWDYNTGFIVADIKESTTNFESAAFHFNANSNTFFYSDPIGNTIKCYDLNKRRVVKTITLENLGYSNKWISTLHDCSKWVVAQSASNSTIKNPIYEFYDLNINDNKIVKTGELHKDIWEMQLLNKGEDILCKLASPESNNKNEMYLDIAPFTTCTKKGEMLGSVEIKNLYHWVVNEQGTEVAFVTKQYKTDKNENWGMQIHIYSLPQFAKLKTISLPNYTSANINKKFSQIVGLKQADYPYDSLYLTKVSDMSIIKKATVDNLYTSSNPFLFSAKDEFVFIRKDSSFIKWGIGCEKVELSKQDCTSFYVDTLRRKAYYSNDGYLSSIKLNTISKGEKLDNIKSDVKLISNSLGFVIYTKYGRLAGIDNDTICVKDPNGKRIISIVGKFINATAKFSDTIVVAFIPKKYTGFIHLQYYSSLGKFISADSIAGDFPVFFSNVKPYLICSNKEANKRILYNYKSKNEMKNFSINYRVMNEEYLSNFCFDESDNAVFWAESTVLKKYDILVDSIYTH